MSNAMKYLKISTVVFFIQLTVFSCQPRIQRDLDLAEDLIQTRPDSALSYLQAIAPNRLNTKKANARFALLMSAALDKNFIDVSSDSLITRAINYYSEHGDTRLKMLAYYYYGITLKNGKHFPAAIIAFEKAEKEATTIRDNYQLGLIFRNKASVFSEINNNQEAIESRKKAISCFMQAQATLYQTYAERSLATDYINNREYEKADSLLTIILEKSEDLNLIHQCSIRKAGILVIKGKNPEIAINYYRETPQKYYSFLDYSFYALALEMLGQKDSADYWLSKGYAHCRDRGDSASLDYMKARIAMRREQYEDAYHLVDGAMNTQDSLTRILLRQSVSGAQRDYYKAETARREAQLKNVRKEKALGWIIGILVALSCFIGLVSVSREKDRQLQEQIARLALEKKNFNRANKDNAHLVGSLLSARVEHLDELSRVFFKAEDEQEKEDAFRQIKQCVASLRNNPEVFLSLEEDLNHYCNGIIAKLRKQVPRINGDNLLIITLFFAGFPYEVVQLIMNRTSVNSLKMARYRFRKEIMAAQAEDEDFFLEMLDMKKRPQDNTNENKEGC